MKHSIIFLLAISLTLVTGCDFFRTLAGRPTSADIEQKRCEIKEAERIAIEVEQMRQDSLAALDTIAKYGGLIRTPEDLGGIKGNVCDTRYCIIVGSFRKPSNADAFIAKISKAGYEPFRVRFRNGLVAVALCPSDKITDLKTSLLKVKKESFCPKEVLVLVNE